MTNHKHKHKHYQGVCTVCDSPLPLSEEPAQGIDPMHPHPNDVAEHMTHLATWLSGGDVGVMRRIAVAILDKVVEFRLDDEDYIVQPCPHCGAEPDGDPSEFWAEHATCGMSDEQLAVVADTWAKRQEG